MATIKDIAKKTGLGLATISKYLNGGNVLERNRIAIEAAIEELDFTVNEFARGLKSNHSRTVGVVIPELSNLFVTTIITVMEDVLRRNGYSAVICDCRTDPAREAEAVRFLMGKRVDGIINMPVSQDSAHLAAPLEKGVPVVLLDRMIPALRERVNAVLVDNVGASTEAVQALIQAGHREIGVILGPKDVFTSQQRLLGCHQAMIGAGMMPDDGHIAYSDYTVQGGYECMKRLLRQRPPTAVFVTNYEMTLGAIIAVNELGVRLPGELSMIGFDNFHLSQVIRPRLTVVTQPLEEIGAAAAGILLKAFEDPARPPEIQTLSTSIQQGESVRPLG